MVPQNVYEFWDYRHPTNRCQRARLLGQVQFARIKRLFCLLTDLPTLFSEWEALVGAYACHGRVSFDARLVASMRTHGVTRLLTFNGADFARLPGLTVINPAAVTAPTTPPPSTPP